MFLQRLALLAGLSFTYAVDLPTAARAEPPLHKPCWIRCGDVPKIADVGAIGCLLNLVPRPLNLLAQITGFFTTPLFKEAGIQGWRDYGFEVHACGQVYDAKRSSDLIRTVDIHVQQIGPTGGPPVWIPATARLRLEIFHHVDRGIHPSPKAGTWLDVQGELMWDADGWLEVHPKVASAVHVSLCPIDCPPKGSIAFPLIVSGKTPCDSAGDSTLSY